MNYNLLLNKVQERGIVVMIDRKIHEMSYHRVMSQLKGMHKKRLPYELRVRYKKSTGERVEQLFCRAPFFNGKETHFTRVEKYSECFAYNSYTLIRALGDLSLYGQRTIVELSYTRTTNNHDNTLNVRQTTHEMYQHRTVDFDKTYHI